MVHIGNGSNQVSRELIEAGRKALANDGKIQGSKEITDLLNAGFKDETLTEGEKRFLNALQDGKMGNSCQGLNPLFGFIRF